MIIDQLPLLASDVQDTDEFPIERGTTTYKTTRSALVKSAADAAAAAQSTADGAQSAAAAAQESANVALTRAMPSGGTTGQVLAKASNTSYNTQWIDPPDPSGFVSYAEAQTLTDAQQTQARENIGANWDLLWQNASPTSEFAAQTITFDYSAYDFLAIIVANRTGQPQQQTIIFEAISGKGYTTSKNTLITSSAYWQYRDGTLTATGLSITDALECYYSTAFHKPVTANALLIPIAICGIKNL